MRLDFAIGFSSIRLFPVSMLYTYGLANTIAEFVTICLAPSYSMYSVHLSFISYYSHIIVI
jgi:hypothetical protein